MINLDVQQSSYWWIICEISASRLTVSMCHPRFFSSSTSRSLFPYWPQIVADVYMNMENRKAVELSWTNSPVERTWEAQLTTTSLWTLSALLSHFASPFNHHLQMSFGTARPDDGSQIETQNRSERTTVCGSVIVQTRNDETFSSALIFAKLCLWRILFSSLCNMSEDLHNWI